MYQGVSVEIVGYYHCCDVLHENQQTLVSRSDWVIADAGGAIYVNGLAPAGLTSASLADTCTMRCLSATVNCIEQSNIVYLSAERIEIWTSKPLFKI